MATNNVTELRPRIGETEMKTSSPNDSALG